MSDINPKSGWGGRRPGSGRKRDPRGRRSQFTIYLHREVAERVPGCLADLPLSDHTFSRIVAGLLEGIVTGTFEVTRKEP